MHTPSLPLDRLNKKRAKASCWDPKGSGFTGGCPASQNILWAGGHHPSTCGGERSPKVSGFEGAGSSPSTPNGSSSSLLGENRPRLCERVLVRGEEGGETSGSGSNNDMTLCVDAFLSRDPNFEEPERFLALSYCRREVARCGEVLMGDRAGAGEPLSMRMVGEGLGDGDRAGMRAATAGEAGAWLVGDSHG